MVFPTNFMKFWPKAYTEITVEPDEYCYGDPWGETTCPNLTENNKCKDIKECYECKHRRIMEILNSIKYKDEKYIKLNK